MPVLPIPTDILLRWFQRRYFVKYPSLFRNWLLERDHPDVVLIELTNSCNQACPFCSREFMTRKVGNMPFEVFTSLIDQMTAFPQTLLRLMGLGEVSLHPRFKDCVAYASEQGIPIEITSNGHIFEVLSPKQIVESSIVRLAISIDGFGDGTYEKMRPGGNYKRLREQVEEFYRYKKGKSDAPLFTIRNVLLGKTPEKRAAQAERFRGEWSELCDGLGFNDYVPARLTEVNEGPPRVCDDILYNLHIEWDGRTPLCTLQHTICEAEYTGNVYDVPLAEVWNDPRRVEVRQAHVNGDLSTSKFCLKCPKARPGAVYNNEARYGSFQTPVLHALERVAWRLIR
ncbi:radical SAM protein [Aurantiacibacter poecillastricola]|uniref:radical SAM protein n=1 Tax=Aurantiacibacter poecillastricola TaxID=3064385 RepID=UPI00273DDF8D|nr:radical SAM protein [Aurantiacibacter sp. 219JJ12-13]MDP5261590.1 radical SAM protein [Aurantiacibacter sp. 219JJ12-13]